jgi:hypothetical protein
MSHRIFALALSILAAACGSSSSDAEEATTSDGTSGGEATDAEARPDAPRGPSSIAVPQTPIERGLMRAAVQQLLVDVEQAADVRAPAPPAMTSTEAIEQWASGPFLRWIEARRAAVARAQQAFTAIDEPADWERGLGAGLLGYVYEDTVAGVRGAPVPDAISGDPELLQVYTDTLAEALRPYAQSAAEAYAVCARSFAEHGDAAWAEWVNHCATRAREVVTAYGIPVPGAADDEDDELGP